eukprot:316571-Pelagomonas_calceolata.AAC.3
MCEWEGILLHARFQRSWRKARASQKKRQRRGYASQEAACIKQRFPNCSWPAMARVSPKGPQIFKFTASLGESQKQEGEHYNRPVSLPFYRFEICFKDINSKFRHLSCCMPPLLT